MQPQLTGVTVLGWYDGIAYRLDENNNKLSRESKQLIQEDELCRYGQICKVEKIGEYDYKILSSRPDK